MTTAKRVRICKDCLAEGVTTNRAAIYPGPRCYTHWLAFKKKSQLRAKERKVEANFSLTGVEYDALYAAQGYRCFICRVSTGKIRRLSVDHDHKKCMDHAPERGCRKCIRALLCKRCNQLVAWWGVEALLRAIEVLTDPPAQKVLADLENTSSFT